MRPCRAISARRCCNCRGPRNRSPHWSTTWSAIRNPCCAASRETRREITFDGPVLRGPALRLCVGTAGSFLYSERAAAGRERGEDGAPSAGAAPRVAAIAVVALGRHTQLNGDGIRHLRAESL